MPNRSIYISACLCLEVHGDNSIRFILSMVYVTIHEQIGHNTHTLFLKNTYGTIYIGNRVHRLLKVCYIVVGIVSPIM